MTGMSTAISIHEAAAVTGLSLPADRPAQSSLHAEIQGTLVPPISFHGAGLDVHGQSIPKDEIGGDLADLVVDGEDVIAYVLDVSGHGLRAGILMGMIKTAMRYGLMLRRPMTAILDDINRVLPSVKASNLFATLAALRFDGSRSVEYVSAGHIPLLQYRAKYGDIVRHSIPQFPLGMFPGANYVSRRIPYESGDIFALVTDGIVEAGEDGDADIGFEQLERVVRDLATRPLQKMAAAVHLQTSGFGAPHDDRTVLLIRAIDVDDSEGEPERKAPNESVEVRETIEMRWRKLLDELSIELTRD